MVWQSMMLVIAGLLAVADVEDAAGDAEAETMRFQGTWVLVSTERDGKVAEPASLKGGETRWVFQGDEMIAKTGDKVVSLGTFKLDPSQTPRWYSRTYSDGTPRRGIYRLEGDTLTICLAGLDKDRPTAFGTKPGDGLTQVVYQREKP